MKNSKKIQLSLLLAIISIVGSVYANDNQQQEQTQASVMIDAEGRTPLMNYVIEQETEIARLKLLAFNKFFNGMEYNSVLYYFDLIGFIQETFSSYYQVQEYKDLYAGIEKAVNGVGKIITQMGPDKTQLTHQDMYGKTVLNYCYTKEIYNKLRACGVPFQADVWTYMYRHDLTSPTGMATIITAAAVAGTVVSIGVLLPLIVACRNDADVTKMEDFRYNHHQKNFVDTNNNQLVHQSLKTDEIVYPMVKEEVVHATNNEHGIVSNDASLIDNNTTSTNL